MWSKHECVLILFTNEEMCFQTGRFDNDTVTLKLRTHQRKLTF